MNILVSACLLGQPCRYDGSEKPDLTLLFLNQDGHTLVPVCPEVLGGLPTPRSPCEIQPDGRVKNKAGFLVTDQFNDGAQMALELAQEHNCTMAILKERSPSCGSGKIHDGSFQGKLIDGMGVTAQLLVDNGITVIAESQIEDYFELDG